MAMGIIQALKLQEGPIDALTRLDQRQIIALAQQKRIPQDMVSVILNEKALNEQEAANIAAAQKTMPASVIEQAIAINAQAEAMRNQPQMRSQMPMMAMASQQEMPPMDTGVASLPVPEEMYSGEGYAGGGIVAFDNGGGIDLASMYNAATKEMDEDSARREVNPYVYSSRVDPNRIAELVETRGAMRERIAPQSAKVDAIQRYLDDQARKNTDVRTDAWTRALEAGLGILGSDSPYALTNIGKGAQAAVKGFAEDVKERRKQTLADMQLQLQLDEAARKEKLGDITAAEATALKELEAERDLEKSRITAQKEKVMDTYAKNFLDAYRNDPRFKGMSEAQIMQLGREDYLNRSGAALMRGQAAGTQAATSAEEVERKRFADASQLAEKTIFRRMSNDPRNLKYKELLKTDKDAALRYKTDVIRSLIVESGGVSSASPAPPAAPAAPAAAPAPKKGNAMFPSRGGVSVTAPNGQVFTFPNQAAADKFRATFGAK
jgi:hypothetical protein